METRLYRPDRLKKKNVVTETIVMRRTIIWKPGVRMWMSFHTNLLQNAFKLCV